MFFKSSSGSWPVLCLLYGATMWGVLWYPLRLLEGAGLSGLWVSLTIYSAALLLGMVLARGHWAEWRRHPWKLAALAVLVGWTNIAFILALLDGNVVRVILLFYLSPLWATLLSWLFLGERLSASVLALLALAMVGALIMLWDPMLGSPWPQEKSDWLAISSGVTFAASNVLIRRLQDVSVRTKTLVSWWGTTLLAAIWILSIGLPLPEVSWQPVTAALLLGILGISSMTLAVQYGVTHMPVQRSAVILLFELVAAAISAQLLAAEVVSPSEWVGGGLIILAAYLSSRSSVFLHGKNKV
ncbi:MAG: DMT family transporter [Gammaproteobacteria bacterium]|nr:DMT family transporter [Gammaproteobacteria bacterium]